MAGSSGDSNLEDLVEYSMDKRLPEFCDPDSKKSMLQRARGLLKEDAPGQLLAHQIEDLLLMSGQESNNEANKKFHGGRRGGLLCEVAGAGKTVIALVHSRMSSGNGPILILAPKKLIDDVWQVQIETWLRDASYVTVKEGHELDKIPEGTEDTWRRHFVLLNKDMLKLHEDAWEKLKKLKPEYLFVDEGTELGSEDTRMGEMVGKLKANNTVTWVISAMPFKAQDDPKLFAATIVNALPYYDTRTQMSKRRQSTGSIPAKLKKEVAAAVKNLFFLGAEPKEQSEVRRFHFIIRHSAKSVDRFMPKVVWKEHEYANAEDRKEKFMTQIRRKRKLGDKILVAGTSPEERTELSHLLNNPEHQAEPVQHIDFHGPLRDVAASVAAFASQEEIQIALLSDRVMHGIDGLKKAKTVLFWSDQHPDYTDTARQTTCIKRACRLGSEHKSVNVEYFTKVEEDDPTARVKRQRVS